VTNSTKLRDLATTGDAQYVFRQVALHFEDGDQLDVFALKNNKSVRETLMHRRYAKLASETKKYSSSEDMRLGEFLLSLKRDGDAFYKRFLNKPGNKRYSNFCIKDPAVLAAKGVYAFYVGNRLKYIGRCRDTMRRRINQGYGRIHPKNCYIDGQSTNCHLNANITEHRESVSLWFCPLTSNAEINSAESLLIAQNCPAWNVQRA